MNINETYCGDYFTVYRNTKSFCTSETTIMLYVNFTSKKKENAAISKKKLQLF